MENPKGPCQKPAHTRGCRRMPNVNIPETEKKIGTDISGEEKTTSRGKNVGHGRTGEQKKGVAYTEMDRQQPRRYEHIRTDS